MDTRSFSDKRVGIYMSARILSDFEILNDGTGVSIIPTSVMKSSLLVTHTVTRIACRVVVHDTKLGLRKVGNDVWMPNVRLPRSRYSDFLLVYPPQNRMNILGETSAKTSMPPPSGVGWKVQDRSGMISRDSYWMVVLLAGYRLTRCPWRSHRIQSCQQSKLPG